MTLVGGSKGKSSLSSADMKKLVRRCLLIRRIMLPLSFFELLVSATLSSEFWG